MKASGTEKQSTISNTNSNNCFQQNKENLNVVNYQINYDGSEPQISTRMDQNGISSFIQKNENKSIEKKSP